LAKLFGAARKFRANEDAAAMVEYALMVSLIALACATAISSMTGSFMPFYQKVIDALS
jgi:Flp pilus assembly pilin Flp